MLLGSTRSGSTALSYRNYVITPGWRLMRAGYRTCIHPLYDEKIGSAIRRDHIRNKEHLNRRISSFHKYLLKCQNNDNNFSIKIEAIVRYVGNLRIKEALLISKLHPQINSKL